MNSQCSRQMKVMTQSQLKEKQKISLSIQSILVDSLFALSWTKKKTASMRQTQFLFASPEAQPFTSDSSCAHVTMTG